MKKRANNLLFLAAATFLIIFIFEVVLYIVGYQANSLTDYFRLKVSGELLGEYDENLFWRLKDVTPDFKTESGKNSLKIMCLTDSVSVMYKGKGYPDLLQDLLANAIPQENPIVFNGGVPGYTSFQGLKYFTTELLFINQTLSLYVTDGTTIGNQQIKHRISYKNYLSLLL